VSLAISDICGDLDEAFPVAADRRRFMWRRIGRFVPADDATWDLHFRHRNRGGFFFLLARASDSFPLVPARGTS
jgi:hypothetical protein